MKTKNKNDKTIENIDFLNRNYLRWLILLSSLSFFLTFIISWIFYPDAYLPLKYYISYLGRIKTVNGSSNIISMDIFSVGIWIVSLFSFLMAWEYFTVRNRSKMDIIKGIILFTTMFSSFLIGLPCDSKYHLVHSLGAIVYYISFNVYILFCQFKGFRKQNIDFNGEYNPYKITPGKYPTFIMLVITSIYFGAFFMNLKYLLPIIQKFIAVSFVIEVALFKKEDF